eukprot:XP_024449892.1 uncharacterized protein LOC112326445 [Populus trichocarpa]
MELQHLPAGTPYIDLKVYVVSQLWLSFTLLQTCAACASLEEFGSDKSKCQEHFDVYKECKKKEREARLERNKSHSFFS